MASIIDRNGEQVESMASRADLGLVFARFVQGLIGIGYTRDEVKKGFGISERTMCRLMAVPKTSPTTEEGE